MMYKFLKLNARKSMLKRPQYGFAKQASFLEMVETFFKEAASYTNIPPDRLALLKNANAVIKLNIPLVRDDGTFTTVEAFRCHHKMHKLPCKGGTRLSQHVD